MTELNDIDGWKQIALEERDDISDCGKAWRKIDTPNKEIIIDRSNPDEPRDWTVILPDGRQRYSRQKDIVETIAALYMRTGTL